MREKLIYEDLTYKINGILFSVHNERGRYCNEKQYADAIEQKLKEVGFNYEREKRLSSSFKGEPEGRNIVDFLIEDKVVVEIKAKRSIGKDDYYQAQRYLRALGKKLALLVNFRNKNLRIKRILNPDVNE